MPYIYNPNTDWYDVLEIAIVDGVKVMLIIIALKLILK